MEPRRTLFEALSEIALQINTVRDSTDLFAAILNLAMETLDAERGFVLVVSASDPRGFEIRYSRNFSSEQIDDVINVSSGVVRQVLETREPVLVHEAQTDQEFGSRESVILQGIQSIVCVPLRVKNRHYGAIYLDSLSRRSRFTPDSLPFLRAFANQAAVAIENVELYQSLRDENRLLRTELHRATGFPEIVGSSAPMRDLFDVVSRVAYSDATVLLHGESGTGKELVARALHQRSPRSAKPLVTLFCGSIPDSLIESELFGHKKGAFTGATSDKHGLFEAATGGTVFLDEVSELTPVLQMSLLRVLQEGEVRRVGETTVRKVDVRIISATNCSLEDMIEAGTFRQDLYYRLNTIPISLPSLRQRREDIPLLANHFLDKYASSVPGSAKGFDRGALDAMAGYHWPGNVRELENAVQRAVVLARGSMITASDLRLPDVRDPAPVSAGLTLKEMERQLTMTTLDACSGNVSETARRLGVSRNWVHYKLKEWEDPSK